MKLFQNQTNSESGQALVTLLFFTVIGMMIITAATSILFSGMFSSTSTQQGQEAYYAAESGVEDALLRLLRNPAFTSGGYAALPSGSGQASVTVSTSGTNTTIKSTGVSGSTVRIIQVVTTYNGGKFTISSWKEVNN